MFTARSLDAHGVELQEFKRVGAAIIAQREFRPELLWPRDVAHVFDEGEADRVVRSGVPDADVVASLGDVLDGAVLAFTSVLEGHASVLRRPLDLLAAFVGQR
jgi:hypothetical protein